MVHSAKHPDAPWRNFHGRVKGKTLKPAQLRDLEAALDLPEGIYQFADKAEE